MVFPLEPNGSIIPVSILVGNLLYCGIGSIFYGMIFFVLCRYPLYYYGFYTIYQTHEKKCISMVRHG